MHESHAKSKDNLLQFLMIPASMHSARAFCVQNEYLLLCSRMLLQGCMLAAAAVLRTPGVCMLATAAPTSMTSPMKYGRPQLAKLT
jgi:hypothetical protein